MDNLIAALSAAVVWAGRRAPLPPDLAARLDAIKTQNYYGRQIRWATGRLYRGTISREAYEDYILDLMDDQLTRAWNEGMRRNGLDPAKDMTLEFEAELTRLKLNELVHIPDFAAAVQEARQKDDEAEQRFASLPALEARAQLWAARYKDIVEDATLFTAEPDDRLEWQIGQTEEHCETCQALNGIVASAAEWEASGFQPQNPPNRLLECGGWRCDCSLSPTDKRRTRNRQDIFDALRL